MKKHLKIKYSFIRKLKIFYFFIMTCFFFSCSKEQFSSIPQNNSQIINKVNNFSDQYCADYTLYKPKVDFLFLWDNTGSQHTSFIDPSTRSKLAEVVDNISSQFDYHIVLAPLMASNLEGSYMIIDRPQGLSANILNKPNFIVPFDEASRALASIPSSQNYGGVEAGIDRTIDLIQANSANGIFRQNAYLYIVIMSNGDETAFAKGKQIDQHSSDQFVSSRVRTLKQFKQTLSLNDLRVFSLVAHTKCSTNFSQNERYKKVSARMYEVSSTKSASDNLATPDSYDLCLGSKHNLFEGINNTIKMKLVANRFRYWPIAKENSVQFDPSSIRVFKNNGIEFFPIKDSSGNGFNYIDSDEGQGPGIVTRNLREYPTVGDPFTGHLIELFGSAKVTYPECLIVKTSEPLEWYGYIRLQAEPMLDTLVLKINGNEVPKYTGVPGSSGWEFIPGYQKDFNIRVRGPTQDNLQLSPITYSGYFLKLHGTSIFNNNNSGSVDIFYRPAAQVR